MNRLKQSIDTTAVMRGGSYHIIIVVLKRQNRLKVGTDKPKLKVRMQSVLEKKKTS